MGMSQSSYASYFTGSSSDDAPLGGLPPAFDTPSAVITGSSWYFTPAANTYLTHEHPHTSAACAVAEAALLEHLPADIVQRILDHAEIWAACRRSNRRNISVQAGGHEPHGKRGERWRTGQEDEIAAAGVVLRDSPGNVWYLVSEGLGCGGDVQSGGKDSLVVVEESSDDEGNVVQTMKELQVRDGRGRPPTAPRRLSYAAGGKKRWWARRIVVEMFSKDQGWVVETSQQDYGTYRNSFSWFELGIVRDGKEWGERYRIQSNVVAGAYYKAHTVVLGREHELLQLLQEGDRVVLWLRAESPGWMNRCRRAALTIHAAPFAPQ